MPPPSLLRLNLEDEALRRIPFEQRVTQPRLARRMNHPFKYLYRHGFDETIQHHIHNNTASTINKNNNNNNNTTSSNDSLDMEDPYTFLNIYGNYSHEQIQNMNASFPMLLQLSVRQQLYPKLQFLKYTILQGTTPTIDATATSLLYALVPPYYYGARLERILAPRHAFLVWTRHLPYGVQLLEPTTIHHDPTTTIIPNNEETTITATIPSKFHEFLYACRNTKHFAAMCQKWANENCTIDNNTTTATATGHVTAKDIEAFDVIFGRGLLSICRNDLVQENNTWAMDQLQQQQQEHNYNVRAADLIPILISHGANVYERDHRGATLLHWASGTGHLDIVQQLVPYFNVTYTITTRDGATPLHWSAAGCNTREFGIGGHVQVCEYLLDLVRTSASLSSMALHQFINQCTYDGNSPLMWAAWSGTIETVKLLVRNKAITTLTNRNGCSVAHWAASGGNVDVCQYLHNVANVDFTVTNYAGNTPLSHAVAFGRTAVVDWLLHIVKVQNEDKMLMYTLAQDFVEWTDGEEKNKRKILQQFDDNGLI